MKIKPFFRWYDLWIGVFIDKEHGVLYVCPIPMFGFKVMIPIRHYLIVSRLINKPIGCCYNTKDVNETDIDFVKVKDTKCPVCNGKNRIILWGE